MELYNGTMIQDWKNHLSAYVESNDALKNLESHAQLKNLIDTITATKSPVIITGFGTSLIVGEKFSHHLRSIGIPAVALRPSDAEHGDLGLVVQNSVFIVVSKSGKLDNLENVISVAESRSCMIFVISESSHVPNLEKLTTSKIGNWITIPGSKESDRFGIIPTTSVVRQLILLDYIGEQVSILLKRNTNDFLVNHPSGNLASYLGGTIADLYYPAAFSVTLDDELTISRVIAAIESGKRGLCVLVDKKKSVSGVISEGDIRRLVIEHGSTEKIDYSVLLSKINREPRSVHEDSTIAEVWSLLRREPSISCLVVTSLEGEFLGLLHARDLQP
jgi:arabinose-5-phosphate isomerase